MNDVSETTNDKRQAVAEDYARAVTEPGGSCCCSPVPKGVVAKLAGYTNDEMAALPVEAVVNSFGCGNPLAFSAVQPGQTVLDLGSGAGIDLLIAAKKVGDSGRVIGVDMTDVMIEKARVNISEAGVGNAEVRKGVIEELPVDDASVDWVISNCVINLSPEKHRVFAEIARVLKPGGRMLVSDIVAEGLPEDISEHRRLYSSCLAGAIEEAAYLDGLRLAGLADVEVCDRLVYDTEQIAEFIGSELEVSEADNDGTRDSLAATWAPKLQGKVVSVKVAGRKPTA